MSASLTCVGDLKGGEGEERGYLHLTVLRKCFRFAGVSVSWYRESMI